jgi:hypothetical protein
MNMMTRLTVFCLLFVNIVYGGTIRWHSGAVVLQSKKVVTGEVAVQLACNVILLREGAQVSVYPAHKILSAYYYDPEENINRKFISINKTNVVAATQLFEIVLSGNIQVLRKSINDDSTSEIVDAAQYKYFLYHDKEILAIRKFRTKFYAELARNSALAKFVHVNRLNPNSTADVLRIVDFYNKEFSNTNMMASRN